MSGPALGPPRVGPEFSSVFRTGPVAAAVNHLLRGAAWARTRLAPHTGKTVRFNLTPFSVAFTILPSGEVAAADSERPHDACFTLEPGVALRIAAAEASALQQARVDGDAVLAHDVLHIAQNLRWDVEEDLSHVFGDIVAHRIVTTGRAFHRWQLDTLDHLARSAVAYWTEEQPLIAAKPDIERFNRAVDTLRDDVARLEKRIERLAPVDGKL